MDNSPADFVMEWAAAGFLAGAAGLGHYLAKQIWHRYQHGSTPLSTWRKDQQISLLLREVKTVCEADRAFVALFENGTKYAGNRDKWRYTWAYEDAGRFSSVSNWRQNVPTTLVPDEMELIEMPGPAFKQVEEMKDGTFRHMCSDIGTHAVARCLIRGSVEPLGFLGLEWTRKVERPAQVDMLSDFAGRFEQLLSRMKG